MVDTATPVDTNVEGSTSTVETTTGMEQKPFIVGEHSVYKTVEDLYKGAIQKEQYIQKLQKENAELLEKLDSINMETNLVEEFQQLRKGNTPMMNEDNQMSMSNTNAPMTDEDIKQIALKAMQENAEKQRKETNLAECKSLLGSDDNAVNLALKNKAKELGVTEEDLLAMAADKPQLFKRLIGVQATTKTFDFMPSSIRTSNNTQENSGSIYEDFRKNCTNPRYVADFVNRAMKDPSMVDSFEWKVK